MIFANGDCSITYQQETPISEKMRDQVKESFYALTGHEYMTDIITTENTVTFLYEPISIMEAYNTIEPCEVMISEVTEFLAEKRFLK